MNLLIMFLYAGTKLLFVTDSPDLLVKIMPASGAQQVTVHYSFSGAAWQSVVAALGEDREFSAVLDAPDTLHVVGLYYTYDGYRDDNKGELYLYEISRQPKMIMPFTYKELGVMVEQARKKITTKVHVSEAIRLLEYLDELLVIVPTLKGSSGEQQRDLMRIEIKDLRDRIGK